MKKATNFVVVAISIVSSILVVLNAFQSILENIAKIKQINSIEDNSCDN